MYTQRYKSTDWNAVLSLSHVTMANPPTALKEQVRSTTQYGCSTRQIFSAYPAGLGTAQLLIAPKHRVENMFLGHRPRTCGLLVGFSECGDYSVPHWVTV